MKGRATLADDAGMLFVLAKPAEVCMWMKDTPIALSVAFLDAEGSILNIADMEPNSEAQHCSAKPAAYALEVGVVSEFGQQSTLRAGVSG